MFDVRQISLGKNSCGSYNYKTGTRCNGTFNVPYLVPTGGERERKHGQKETDRQTDRQTDRLGLHITTFHFLCLYNTCVTEARARDRQRERVENCSRLRRKNSPLSLNRFPERNVNDNEIVTENAC